MATAPFRINCMKHFCKTSIASSMARKLEAVIIDLSGTIHIEDNAIPGSHEAIKRLKQSSLKVKFVTNTTKEPLRVLHERLQRLSFDISRDEIFTSLTAAKTFVEAKKVRPLLLLEEEAKEDFAGIETSDPNAVVVGLAPSCFNFDKMNEAFRLMMAGAPLVAIHKARYFKMADGNLHLGPGGYVTALEYATGATAEVVGKPEKAFFLESIKDLGVEADKTVMIGDDARDDVKGAIDAGMMGILVKTGKYRQGDETKFNPNPSVTCADFPAAVDFILSELS